MAGDVGGGRRSAGEEGAAAQRLVDLRQPGLAGGAESLGDRLGGLEEAAGDGAAAEDAG